MFSKPLAFGLLALGCLTAAAGGAYVATRHNAADAVAAPARAASAPARPSAAPVPVDRPVSETEATVAASKPSRASEPPRKAEPARTSAPAKDAPSPARENRARSTTPLNAAASLPLPKDAAPPLSAAAAAPIVPPTAPPAAEPVTDPTPEPPAESRYEEVIVPASAVIGLQLETSISTERARTEDRVEARVTRDVLAGGRLAIPAGARVIGSVTLVERGGKMRDRARLGIRFHTLVLGDHEEVALQTETIYRDGESPSADSARKIGGAAIGGAILGAILGGGKGAFVGGMAGAGGGSAAVLAGERNAAVLPAGAIVTARLSQPVSIQIERHDPE